MSEELINQITLNCLMNKHQYEKYVANKISKSIDDDDKKFYRKRIYCLTKELLLSKGKEKEKDKDLSPDVKYAFDNYVKSCIHYFKVLDRHDILQDEYKDIDSKSEEKEELLLEDEKLEINKDENLEEKLFVRSIKMCNPSLDSFVTVTSTKKPEEFIIPQQREINLQDPILMNKGI
jgi:hypothetical protein